MYTNIVEIIYMFKKAKISPYIGYSLGVGLRFIPISISEIYEVINSQKARGLKISIRSIRKIKIIIMALTIPIITGLLKKIYINWIAMRMKGISPLDNYYKMKYQVTISEITILLLTIGLWLIPEIPKGL